MGCNKDESTANDGPTHVPTETIKTTWADEGMNIFDLSDASFTEQTNVFVTLANGNEVCECNSEFFGDEEAGEMHLSKCLYIRGIYLIDYSTCDSMGLVDEFTYTRTSTTLTLCSKTQNYCDVLVH